MEARVAVEFEQFFPAPGNETWFQFYVYPQPGEGIILYCRNTTETRKAEQALRRSEQLAAAGRLAASIAHEINNPLEAVTNLLFLAKSDVGLSSSSKALARNCRQGTAAAFAHHGAKPEVLSSAHRAGLHRAR